MTAEHGLKVVLRVVGSSSLLAVIFIAAPYEWMDSIHRSLGMGRLPDEPVVGYLARSNSALYALLGGLLWVVSVDPKSHRTVLLYLAVAITLMGVVLLIVDWWEGLPLYWKLWEGPFVVVLGVFVGWLTRRIPVSN